MCPFLRPALCCDSDVVAAGIDGGPACVVGALLGFDGAGEERAGGGDGGTGEAAPEDEKKSELRDGGAGEMGVLDGGS